MSARIAVLLFALACAPKAPAPAPATEAPPPPPTVDVPPPPPPRPAPNADLQAKITRADGTVTEGRVVRIERGVDRYAADGWADDAARLRISLERDGAGREAPWSDVKRVEITLSDLKGADCFYDSAVVPYVYLCVLRTDARVVTTDDAAWSASTAHRWRFTFDDERVEEFTLHRLPVREQDTSTDRSQNYAMYPKLQSALAEEAARAVVRIELSHP